MIGDDPLDRNTNIMYDVNYHSDWQPRKKGEDMTEYPSGFA